MRRLIACLPFCLLALAGILPGRAAAFSYPALDTTSQWNIQDWGFSNDKGFYVQGAEKNTWVSPGQPEARMAFYNLAFLGARLNGVQYPFDEQDFLGELQGDRYLVKYGSFRVTTGVYLVVLLYFFDDGRFETYSYFDGPGYSPSSEWEVVARIDYDMSGSGNNIAEFLWNPSSEGQSLSPPQAPALAAADGRLGYTASTASGPSFWAASAHEISIAYPPLARNAGSGVENLGFARILNASQPQFGMVLWEGAGTPVEATFKAYAAYDGSMAPMADVTTELQLTSEAPGRPRYAYSGRDQMLFLRLGVPAEGRTYAFGGKLFQRGESRALSVTVHQHPAGHLGGWDFDPDMVVRYTEAGGRTFRNALTELSGPEDLVVSGNGNGVPYLPYDGYAAPGHPVTEAQLHNLMTATRDRSQTAMESVRDWRLDLYLVNWTLQGEPEAWEAMFDGGGADANGISREGAAVFWPAIHGDDDFQRKQSVLSALRGAGLALNMDATWGTCSFAGYCWDDGSSCGGRRCGGSCPSGVSGCRYSAYTCDAECVDGSVLSLTDFNQSTIRFNGNAASGSDFSELDWYRYAPEAWVKPGRFGAPPVSGPLPSFIPY